MANPIKSLRESLGKIPIKYRYWTSLGILAALLIALPITLIGLMTGTFELRKRAVTGESVSNPVNWRTDRVSLQAEDFYIITNGQKYFGKTGEIAFHSDPGSYGYTTLEVEWQENEREMRLYMYFYANESEWWLNEIRTYNGQIPGDWITYQGPFFRVPRGVSFHGDEYLLASTFPDNLAGKLYLINFDVQPFFQNLYPSCKRSCSTPQQCDRDFACGTPCPPNQVCIQELFCYNPDCPYDSDCICDRPQPICQPSSIEPSSGPAPLTVTLHGGGGAGSSPVMDGYQWDFENDGVWDTGISLEPVTHVYNETGAYYPKYRVHSINGQWSDVCDYAFPIIVCGGEGETVFVYPGYKCCSGLEAISPNQPDANGNCPDYPLLGASVCVKDCGDGQCTSGENKCNCPEDCGQTPTVIPLTPVQLPSSITLKIRFRGVTSRPIDDSSKNLKIYATNLTGGPDLGSATDKKLVTLEVDDSGVYHGEITLPGDYFGHRYRLRIKGSKHLQSVFPDQFFQAGKELDLTSSPLRPGDLDQDGDVDINDLRAIKVFSTNPADIAFGDLNFDNRVDIFDKVLVLGTLAVQYDPD